MSACINQKQSVELASYFDVEIEQDPLLMAQLKVSALALNLQILKLENENLCIDEPWSGRLNEHLSGIDPIIEQNELVSTIKKLTKHTFVEETHSLLHKRCPGHENDLLKEVPPGRHLLTRYVKDISKIKRDFENNKQIKAYQLNPLLTQSLFFRDMYCIYADYIHELNSAECPEPYKKIQLSQPVSVLNYLEQFEQRLVKQNIDPASQWKAFLELLNF